VTRVSVVLPTFNERENLQAMCDALASAIAPTGLDYELIFVDDNSGDGTIELLQGLRARDPRVKYIIMSRRYGDQPCLMAGLERCTGDVAITMDADLQHPPSYIPSMIEAWRSGAEIVVMRREEAGHASVFKRWTEIAFYRIMAALADSPIIYRFAGYALLDRKVVDALKRFPEREPFLRGLVALVGFRRLDMTYREEQRRAGRSKYSVGRLWHLAMLGFTSFSTAPLYLILYLGIGLGGVAVIGGVALAGIYLLGVSLSYIPWTVACVVLLGAALQLVAVGVLGVYLSKVLQEVRARPTYIIGQLGGLSA
jgi:glycosyltransferase involved in cell wall biosynthesis